MDEQSIVNFLQTLETDTTLPPNQKIKLIKSALNVTSSTAANGGDSNTTATLLLQQESVVQFKSHCLISSEAGRHSFDVRSSNGLLKTL